MGIHTLGGLAASKNTYRKVGSKRMNYNVKLGSSIDLDDELSIIAVSKIKGKINLEAWPSELQEVKQGLNKMPHFKNFYGNSGQEFKFNLNNGKTILIIGVGEKETLKAESLRRYMASIYKEFINTFTQATIFIDDFIVEKNAEKNLEATLEAIVEGIGMADYGFDKYLASKRKPKLRNITFLSTTAKGPASKLNSIITATQKTVEAIKFARDLVNEPPNVLNSEVYAKVIEKDAKKLKNVKIKILNLEQIKKEKMNLLLSVNAGSAYQARVVHLSYTPPKAGTKTKHVALVGKGLTFDTGGYSLKPGASMMNMKYDMAGSATVYAAFRAAVERNPNIKISCYLGITDNAVSSLATTPDSIVKARNGKTVEILNTDAEGRLVLADVLSYACDSKPNVIIDAATLTGAVLVSLGNEICGLMGNDQKLMDELLQAAKACDEYMWQLPIIEEFKKDMQSTIADLKNIGGSSYGGSAKAAAFLSNFITQDIAWAHLDIAGIGDGQGYLSYCPTKGASGLIVRTLVHYLTH